MVCEWELYRSKLLVQILIPFSYEYHTITLKTLESVNSFTLRHH